MQLVLQFVRLIDLGGRGLRPPGEFSQGGAEGEDVLHHALDQGQRPVRFDRGEDS